MWRVLKLKVESLMLNVECFYVESYRLKEFFFLYKVTKNPRNMQVMWGPIYRRKSSKVLESPRKSSEVLESPFCVGEL